jgi:hypothetical protein
LVAQRFQCFGGLDAPDWILAEVSVLAKLSSVRIKLIVSQVYHSTTILLLLLLLFLSLYFSSLPLSLSLHKRKRAHAHLSFCGCVCISVCLSFYPSVSLLLSGVCLPVRPCAHLFVCLSMYVVLCICPGDEQHKGSRNGLRQDPEADS